MRVVVPILRNRNTFSKKEETNKKSQVTVSWFNKTKKKIVGNQPTNPKPENISKPQKIVQIFSKKVS